MIENIESQGTKDMVFSLDQCYLDQWFQQNRLIGSDPEAMILSLNNKVISASKMIDDPNCEESIGIDGAGDPMEFRPNPSDSVKGHLKNLQHLIDSAYNHFYNYNEIAKIMAKPMTYGYSIGGHLQIDMPYLTESKIFDLGIYIQTILAPAIFLIEGKAGFTRRSHGGYGSVKDVRSIARANKNKRRCDKCVLSEIYNKRTACYDNGSYEYLDPLTNTWKKDKCVCSCHKNFYKRIMELRMFGSWLYDMNLASLIMNATIELSVLPTKVLTKLTDLVLEKPDSSKYSYNDLRYRDIYYGFANNGLKTLLRINGLPMLRDLALKAQKYKAKTFNVLVFRDHITNKENDMLTFTKEDHIIPDIHLALKQKLENKNVWVKKHIHLHGLTDREYTLDNIVFKDTRSNLSIGIYRQYRNNPIEQIVNHVYNELLNRNYLKSAKGITKQKTKALEGRRIINNPAVIAEPCEDDHDPDDHCGDPHCDECNDRFGNSFNCGDRDCVECGNHV